MPNKTTVAAFACSFHQSKRDRGRNAVLVDFGTIRTLARVPQRNWWRIWLTKPAHRCFSHHSAINGLQGCLSAIVSGLVCPLGNTSRAEGKFWDCPKAGFLPRGPCLPRSCAGEDPGPNVAGQANGASGAFLAIGVKRSSEPTYTRSAGCRATNVAHTSLPFRYRDETFGVSKSTRGGLIGRPAFFVFCD